MLAVMFPPVLPMVSASASAPEVLRVVGTNASASQASVTVVVPRELANLALPPSAFGMRQDGRLLSLRVQRVSATGLDVYVVLDTTAANTALVAQQSAAADLLRQLPATVRTAVATSEDTVPVPEAGNVAALRAVSAVKPRSDMVVDKTLNRIAGARFDGRRHLIVLMTSCPKDSNTDLSPLKAALAGGTSQLDVVASGATCTSLLLSLAHDRGGLTGIAVTPNQLAEAVDNITYDTIGQYRLSVPAPAKATPVVVTVEFAGVDARTEVLLPTAAGQAAAPPPTPRHSARAGASANNAGGSRLRAVLAVLAGLMLIAGAAAALRITARRKRRSRPTVVGWRSPAASLASHTGLAETDSSRRTLADALALARRPVPTTQHLRLAHMTVEPRAPAEPLAPTEPVAPAERVAPAAAAPEVEPVSDDATTEPSWGGRPAAAPTIALVAAAASAPGGRPASTDPEPSTGALRAHELAFPASGLSDGTIRVRRPRNEDARALHGLAESDGGLAGEWVPLSDHATRADCEALVQSWSRAWGSEHAASALGLVVERGSEGVVIGYVDLRVKPDAIELRCVTPPPYRGQGYAKRALRLVAHWLAQHERAGQVDVILPGDSVSRSVARDAGLVPDDSTWTFIQARGKVPIIVHFVLK